MVDEQQLADDETEEQHDGDLESCHGVNPPKGYQMSDEALQDFWSQVVIMAVIGLSARNILTAQ